MYNFILQTLIMISAGVMIYLMARKVPRIVDVVDERASSKPKGLGAKIDHLLSSLPLEKIDFFVSQLLEKILRKTKLWLMKVDNQLTHHLNKYKKFKPTGGTETSAKPSLFEKEESVSDSEKSENEENKKEGNSF
ncbi:hypothetical protein HZB05_02355 [Candidatus Wolfebacteria bacterium]|nr:hypothetical protein [Candidatus Wolfebacteria bacterium]